MLQQLEVQQVENQHGLQEKLLKEQMQLSLIKLLKNQAHGLIKQIQLLTITILHYSMSAITKQLIMIIFQEIMSKLLEEMEQITLELHQTDGKEIQIMHHHLTINQLGLMLTELLFTQNT